jgi:hypothetical protein
MLEVMRGDLVRPRGPSRESNTIVGVQYITDTRKITALATHTWEKLVSFESLLVML